MLLKKTKKRTHKENCFLCQSCRILFCIFYLKVAYFQKHGPPSPPPTPPPLLPRLAARPFIPLLRHSPHIRRSGRLILHQPSTGYPVSSTPVCQPLVCNGRMRRNWLPHPHPPNSSPPQLTPQTAKAPAARESASQNVGGGGSSVMRKADQV